MMDFMIISSINILENAVKKISVSKEFVSLTTCRLFSISEDVTANLADVVANFECEVGDDQYKIIGWVAYHALLHPTLNNS